MAVLDINAKYAAAAAETNASKKNMIYKSDSGVEYVVLIDENIGETMGFTDYTDTSTQQAIPKGMQMRTVSFQDSSGKVKGQYPVGTPTTPIYVEGGQLRLREKAVPLAW